MSVSIKVAGAAFSKFVGYVPSFFFAGGVNGVLYAPALGNLFQDVAGTVPVTAPGQSVARMNDLSGNGNHATQSVAGSMPTYNVDGNGKPYLAFAGTDDFLVIPALSLFQNKSSGIILGASTFTADTQALCGWNNNTTSTRFSVGAGVSGVGARATTRRLDGTSEPQATVGVRVATPAVVGAIGRWSSGQLIARFNGTASAPVALTGSSNTANTASSEASLGRLGSGGSAATYLTGNIYGFVARGLEPTANELAGLEQYLAGLAGITL